MAWLQFLSKKAPADLWRANPKDLPMERTLALEPQLGNLENNPVFRLQRYMVRRVQRNPMTWLLTIISLACTALFIFPPAALRPYRFYIFIAGNLILTRYSIKMGKQNSRKLTSVLSAQVISDLHLAGFGAREIVLGLWGSLAAPRPTLIRRSVYTAVLFILGAVLIYASGRWTGRSNNQLSWPGLLLFFSGSMRWMAGAYYPYTSLERCLHVVRGQKRLAEWGMKNSSKLRIIGRLFGLWLLLVGVWMAIAVPLIFVAVVLQKHPSYLSWPLLASVCVLMGGLVGWIVGRVCKRRAEKNLESLNRDVAFMMNWGRIKTYDPSALS